VLVGWGFEGLRFGGEEGEEGGIGRVGVVVVLVGVGGRRSWIERRLRRRSEAVVVGC